MKPLRGWNKTTLQLEGDAMVPFGIPGYVWPWRSRLKTRGDRAFEGPLTLEWFAGDLLKNLHFYLSNSLPCYVLCNYIELLLFLLSLIVITYMYRYKYVYMSIIVGGGVNNNNNNNIDIK